MTISKELKDILDAKPPAFEYYSKLQQLEGVSDDVQLIDVVGLINPNNEWGLTKNERIGLSGLLGHLATTPIQHPDGSWTVVYPTVGEIRALMDEELRRLVSSDQGIKVLRRLFGVHRENSGDWVI